MKTLREKILQLIETVNFPQATVEVLDKHISDIIKEFEKTINKVEKDYWKSLPNPYLRGLPMKVSFPKEMDALDKVRKEIAKKGRKKDKKK